MTLKDIYYKIRPMAALRADEKVSMPPVVYFLIAALVSVVGGLASGFEIWILAGFSPDNSGGSLIFVFGSCIMSLLSFVLGLFWKNRAVFYGLNSFTFLTVFLLITSIRITKTA
jgi:hypothetical protein